MRINSLLAIILLITGPSVLLAFQQAQQAPTPPPIVTLRTVRPSLSTLQQRTKRPAVVTPGLDEILLNTGIHLSIDQVPLGPTPPPLSFPHHTSVVSEEDRSSDFFLPDPFLTGTSLVGLFKQLSVSSDEQAQQGPTPPPVSPTTPESTIETKELDLAFTGTKMEASVRDSDVAPPSLMLTGASSMSAGIENLEDMHENAVPDLLWTGVSLFRKANHANSSTPLPVRLNATQANSYDFN
jgi:hypothetical protein